MALLVTPIASDLLLILDAGLDENGQQMTKRKASLACRKPTVWQYSG